MFHFFDADIKSLIKCFAFIYFGDFSYLKAFNI